jgi:spermidine synthase
MLTFRSGLGIGTTPAALVAHGIDTTVVELDPVVHKFAAQYFQLPSNHTAVIEDAVTYTSRMAADESEARYDYIIHDVFTGGAEPIALFTLEFLQNLHTLLKPNGVVAIVRSPHPLTSHPTQTPWQPPNT